MKKQLSKFYFDSYLFERLEIVYIGLRYSIVIDKFEQRHFFYTQHIEYELQK